jgi:hypothetical protein
LRAADFWWTTHEKLNIGQLHDFPGAMAKISHAVTKTRRWLQNRFIGPRFGTKTHAVFDTL